MKKIDFIIPDKPSLVRTTERNHFAESDYPPPPPPFVNKGTGSEIFPRKPRGEKKYSQQKVSNAPPHTKFSVVPSRAITDPRINTRKPLLLLLGAIGIHASVHGICYPSQRRLASICGKSPSWAAKYLVELKQLGYLRRLVPPHTRGQRSAQRLQVLWNGNDPLPQKETRWDLTPWCWH